MMRYTTPHSSCEVRHVESKSYRMGSFSNHSDSSIQAGGCGDRWRFIAASHDEDGFISPISSLSKVDYCCQGFGQLENVNNQNVLYFT